FLFFILLHMCFFFFFFFFSSRRRHTRSKRDWSSDVCSSDLAAHADLVSGNFFETLGVQPALGRLFTLNDETAPGANTVAVLSYGYWSRKFGADPSVLNKPLTEIGRAHV